MKIESGADFRAFTKNRIYRFCLIIYFIGLIVSLVGTTIATFVTHNHLEFELCYGVGVGFVIPWMILGFWSSRQIAKSLRRLDTKRVVLETLYEISDPKGYERSQTIKQIKELFK